MKENCSRKQEELIINLGAVVDWFPNSQWQYLWFMAYWLCK